MSVTSRSKDYRKGFRKGVQFQKNRAEAAAIGEPWDEADDMCPNCVTPWKCNGPHRKTLAAAEAR